MPHGGNTIQLDVTTVLWLLIVAFGAMMVVRRTRLPYTMALVLSGLAVGATHLLEVFHLSYELVFAVFLPPLLFDAAIRLPVELLKRNWKPVALLAAPGVIASTVLVGYAVHYWVGISLLTAFAFGALISATDPVSVLALFRSMKTDKRLSILVEGESLFNDGTAAVLYASLVTAIALGLTPSAGAISLGFARAIVGGAIVGGGVGWGISLIMARLDDHLVEITLTTIAAYGASLLAEAFGSSGVISVISSGIVLGYYRSEAAMSATTRAAVYSFWEYVAFVINSILFLLIGIDVTITRMAHNLIPMGIAVGTVIVVRAIVVYSTGAAVSRSMSRIPAKWQHVLNWGGLRGALAIALALGLPRDVPGRDVVLAMTYGVVLWTLLAQGLTMSWLLRKLGLAGREEAGEEYGRIATQLLANRASLAEIDQLRRERLVSPRVLSDLEAELRTETEKLEEELEDVQDRSGDVLQEQKREACLRLQAAQHNAIRESFESGLVSSATARELETENARRYGERDEES